MLDDNIICLSIFHPQFRQYIQSHWLKSQKNKIPIIHYIYIFFYFDITDSDTFIRDFKEPRFWWHVKLFRVILCRKVREFCTLDVYIYIIFVLLF